MNVGNIGILQNIYGRYSWLNGQVAEIVEHYPKGTIFPFNSRLWLSHGLFQVSTPLAESAFVVEYSQIRPLDDPDEVSEGERTGLVVSA